MKLRIKETGEVLEDVKFIDTTLHKIIIQYLDDGVLREYSINNLSDVEEVKDYEEPKEYWFITWCGEVDKDTDDGLDVDKDCKAIGNYFETKKEAEKATEKLEAWKRLKDKGFKFLWYSSTPSGNSIDFYIDDWDREATRDITLLFGGGE